MRRSWRLSCHLVTSFNMTTYCLSHYYFDSIFIQLLNCQIENNPPVQFSFEYDAEIINDRIINYFNHGSSCPPVHVIILEAGDNPNSDANINAACDRYFDDLQIDDDLGIEVVYDEAIFRRVLKCYQNNSKI